MKILTPLADEAILEELGSRLARARLDQNLSQLQLAARSGVSLRTLARMERGEVAVQLSAFVRVCRSLGLLEGFDRLLPEPAIGPMDELRFKERGRTRASKVSTVNATRQSNAPGLKKSHVGGGPANPLKAERISGARPQIVRGEANRAQNSSNGWVWGDER